MSDHPIQELMKTAMESIQVMVDVDKVVGEPVEAGDGSVIIPVSRVAFGFAAGGADYAAGEDSAHKEQALGFGGGSGAGVTVQPVGFLVVGHGTVRMLPVDSNAVFDRIIDMAPQLIDRLQKMCVRPDR